MVIDRPKLEAKYVTRTPPTLQLSMLSKNVVTICSSVSIESNATILQMNASFIESLILQKWDRVALCHWTSETLKERQSRA